MKKISQALKEKHIIQHSPTNRSIALKLYLIAVKCNLPITGFFKKIVSQDENLGLLIIEEYKLLEMYETISNCDIENTIDIIANIIFKISNNSKIYYGDVHEN